jgi:hypothetical protein
MYHEFVDKLDSLNEREYQSAVNFALGSCSVEIPAKEFKAIIERAIKYAKEKQYGR